MVDDLLEVYRALAYHQVITAPYHIFYFCIGQESRKSLCWRSALRKGQKGYMGVVAPESRRCMEAAWQTVTTASVESPWWGLMAWWHWDRYCWDPQRIKASPSVSGVHMKPSLDRAGYLWEDIIWWEAYSFTRKPGSVVWLMQKTYEPLGLPKAYFNHDWLLQ